VAGPTPRAGTGHRARGVRRRRRPRRRGPGRHGHGPRRAERPTCPDGRGEWPAGPPGGGVGRSVAGRRALVGPRHPWAPRALPAPHRRRSRASRRGGGGPLVAGGPLRLTTTDYAGAVLAG